MQNTCNGSRISVLWVSLQRQALFEKCFFGPKVWVAIFRLVYILCLNLWTHPCEVHLGRAFTWIYRFKPGPSTLHVSKTNWRSTPRSTRNTMPSRCGHVCKANQSPRDWHKHISVWYVLDICNMCWVYAICSKFDAPVCTCHLKHDPHVHDPCVSWYVSINWEVHAVFLEVRVKVRWDQWCEARGLGGLMYNMKTSKHKGCLFSVPLN